ncbi:hypothetical protein STENM223S_05631 [Streptomyces tendae]
MPTAPAGAPQRRDTSHRSADPSTGRSAAPGRRPLTASRRANRAGLAFVSPTFLVVLVVVVLPIAWTVLLAFQKARLVDIQGMGLFGNWSLDNFSQVFDSAGFWSSLGTTLLYTAGATFGSVLLGLVAALALRKPFRGAGCCARRCCCRTSRRSWPWPSCGRSRSARSTASSTTGAGGCSAGTTRSPSCRPGSTTSTCWGCTSTSRWRC